VALFLSTGMKRLTTFILTLYIARALGADALGQFSVVMSLVLIFQTLSFLGQQQIIIREVARAPDRAGDYLVNGSLIVVGGGLLGILLTLIAVNLIGYEPKIVTYSYVASLSLIPGALAIVGESVIQGREQMHHIAFAGAVSGLIKLSLSLTLLFLGFGLWAVFLVMAVANTVLYLVYLRVIRRLVGHIRLQLDRKLVRHLFNLAGTFIIISIFGVGFKQVDVLMLGKLKDSATVGIYSAGFRPIQVGMLFLPAFMLALFPRMSETYVRSPERLGAIVKQALKLLMTFIIPLAVITTVLASDIIPLFYGPGYRESVPVFRILVWMLVFFFANTVLFRTMLASDNERVTMRVACVNVVSNVTLNWLLIPRWGAMGVAVASFCTTLLALLLNYAYTARHLFKLDWVRIVGKPALAAILLGGLLSALRETRLLVSLPIGIIVYVAVVLGLRTFSSDELDYMRRTWAYAKAWISL
jgi:O-antigen/teichoic acid export membrane protein